MKRLGQLWVRHGDSGETLYYVIGTTRYRYRLLDVTTSKLWAIRKPVLDDSKRHMDDVQIRGMNWVTWWERVA